MRWPWSKKAESRPQPEAEVSLLEATLDTSLAAICAEFGNPPDIKTLRFMIEAPHPVRAAVVFLESLADSQNVTQVIMQPLLLGFRTVEKPDAPRPVLIKVIKNTLIAGGQTEDVTDTKQAVQAMLQGSAVVLVDGSPGGFAVGLPKTEGRGVEEPQVEQVLTGPRDGFIENLSTNRTLLRRRLRTEKLRIESYRIGTVTSTDTVLVYIEGLANPEVVEEARKRLERVNVDAILDTQHLEEMLEDAAFSLFPTLGSTERPDACAAQLLEGAVAILCDGSPVALFAPATFFTFFQSPDDYYTRYPGATWARWLRLLGLLISTTFPALFVAIVNFHPELIPFALFVSIAEGRERVPFPLVVEVLIMDVTFELLREAGLRMPRAIGQALSILGALVLGQAAIQAGLVGPHVILIVAITAITSFLVGRTKITQATRLLRFSLLFAAGTLGILGLVLMMIVVISHQVSLRSFGVPYMYPLAPLNIRAVKDVLIRSPRWWHPSRPAVYNWEQSRRLQPTKPSPPGGDGSNQ